VLLAVCFQWVDRVISPTSSAPTSQADTGACICIKAVNKYSKELFHVAGHVDCFILDHSLWELIFRFVSFRVGRLSDVGILIELLSGHTLRIPGERN
jgi:hypothetical protein